MPDKLAGKSEGGGVAGARQFTCRPIQHKAAAEMGADTGDRAQAPAGRPTALCDPTTHQRHSARLGLWILVLDAAVFLFPRPHPETAAYAPPRRPDHAEASAATQRTLWC